MSSMTIKLTDGEERSIKNAPNPEAGAKLRAILEKRAEEVDRVMDEFTQAIVAAQARAKANAARSKEPREALVGMTGHDLAVEVSQLYCDQATAILNALRTPKAPDRDPREADRDEHDRVGNEREVMREWIEDVKALESFCKTSGSDPSSTLALSIAKERARRAIECYTEAVKVLNEADAKVAQERTR